MMTTFAKIVRRIACAIALAPSALHAEAVATPAPSVDVTPSSHGWMVVRERRGEHHARLSYSYAGKPPTLVEGVRDGERWKFRIDEQIPATGLVTLEFQLFSVAEHAEADAALTSGAKAIAQALSNAFPRAAESAVSSAVVNSTVLYSVLGTLTREELASAIRTSKLGKYELDGRPAPDVLLENLGFKQLGPNVWEPTPRTFELLRINWAKLARRVSTLDGAAKARPKDFPPCAGDPNLLQANEAARPARRQAAVACLKAFAASARDLLSAANDEKNTSRLTAELANDAAELAAIDTLAGAPSALFATPETLTDGVGMGLAPKYARAGGRLAESIARTKPADPATLESKAIAAQEMYGAASYLAALELQGSTQAALAKQIEETVIVEYEKAHVAESLTKQDYASELFVVDEPKPRFFISTGVMAAAFNDDWQLALPVIASICVTPSGCETHGAGSGGNQGNYFSFDLGVKTIHLGGDDRREGSPSLLIGFGVTPFYATHFSVGLNAFPNRQSDRPRANAAVYLAVTLDTIDGADILGALGMGKPEVKRVGDGNE